SALARGGGGLGVLRGLERVVAREEPAHPAGRHVAAHGDVQAQLRQLLVRDRLGLLPGGAHRVSPRASSTRWRSARSGWPSGTESATCWAMPWTKSTR